MDFWSGNNLSCFPLAIVGLASRLFSLEVKELEGRCENVGMSMSSNEERLKRKEILFFVVLFAKALFGD